MVALRADGRAAFVKIAVDLGVSPGMIRMRFNRLIESGNINIVAISNPLRMSYDTMALRISCVICN